MTGWVLLFDTPLPLPRTVGAWGCIPGACDGPGRTVGVSLRLMP